MLHFHLPTIETYNLTLIYFLKYVLIYFNNFDYIVFQVQHIHFLSEHIGGLFLNDEYSDVTLVVESNRFNAHKVILAARSEYFR